MIPYRRYSPRTVRLIRCNSEADSIVWMKEDDFFGVPFALATGGPYEANCPELMFRVFYLPGRRGVWKVSI